MIAAREKRAAAAFAGYTSRRLRKAGFAVSPASSRQREGLRVSSQARSRCRIVADLDSPLEARVLIDAVVRALHKDYVRTTRDRDDSVLVWLTGISMDSVDSRGDD